MGDFILFDVKHGECYGDVGRTLHLPEKETAMLTIEGQEGVPVRLQKGDEIRYDMQGGRASIVRNGKNIQGSCGSTYQIKVTRYNDFRELVELVADLADLKTKFIEPTSGSPWACTMVRA